MKVNGELMQFLKEESLRWVQNQRRQAHHAKRHAPKCRPPVVGLSVFTVIALEGLALVLATAAVSFLSPFSTSLQVSLSLSLPCFILLLAVFSRLFSRCFRGGGLVWRTCLGVPVARWWIGDLADGLDDKRAAISMWRQVEATRYKKLSNVYRVAFKHVRHYADVEWQTCNRRRTGLCWFATLAWKMLAWLPECEIEVQFSFFSVK